VLTTPQDLAVCFAKVVRAAAGALGLDVEAMLARTEAARYTTTVRTNSVIQGNDPKLGPPTDAGEGAHTRQQVRLRTLFTTVVPPPPHPSSARC